VLDGHRDARNCLLPRAYELEPRRHLQRSPAAGCRAHLGNAPVGAHPAETGRIDRGLDGFGLETLVHLELRELHLLERFAVDRRHLGAQRHRRLFIEPEPIAVPVSVEWTYLDQAHVSPEQAMALASLELIVGLQVLARSRQRLEQGTFVRPRLDQHDVMIRQVRMHLAWGTDDLAPIAIERDEPLRAALGIDAMHDPHRLGLAWRRMREQPVVIACRKRVRHACEPGAGVVVITGTSRTCQPADQRSHDERGRCSHQGVSGV
jgi:hypothetical protein